MSQAISSPAASDRSPTSGASHLYILAGFAAAVVCSALVSCSSESSRSATASGIDTVRVALSWSVGPEHAFIILGRNDSVFAEQRIVLAELIPTRGSQEVVQLLESGKADFGFVSGDVLVEARTAGSPLRAIMTLIHRSPVTIFSKASAQIKGPADLLRKRVGILPRSATHYQFTLMLREAGLDSNAMTLVPVGADAVSQLVNDRIDALEHYTHWAPPEVRAAGIPVTELLASDNGVQAYSSSLVTTESFLGSRSNVVERVVAAMYLSLVAFRDQPDRALAALLGEPQLVLDSVATSASLRRTHEVMFGDLGANPPGYMTLKGWEDTQATLIRAGRLPTKIDANFFFDGSALATVYSASSK